MGDLRTNEEVAAPLSCGGRGPCCHIGYSHRHCEHCDMVIDTRPAGWYWPISPYVAPSNPWYQPWWSTGMNATTTNLTANANEHLCLTGQLMNLNGVVGDSRKRMEAIERAERATFDQRPECLLCGRRDIHTHVLDLNYAPLSVPRD